MYKLWPDLPPRWIAVGFLTGACLTFALSEPTKPPAPKEKLVVVLRGEKTITIKKPQLQMREIAAELAKQTGQTFTLDKKFEAYKTPYAVLLNKSPLSSVLDATAFVARAKWERRGVNYHLRPPTAKEMATDSNLIGAGVDRLYDYLSTIAADDETLPDGVRTALRDFRREMQEQQTTFPPFADDTMKDWTVRASGNGLGLAYQASQTNGETTTGQSQSRSWGWSNEVPKSKIGR